ncbi:hypothetical protein R2F61_07115 [Mollicutes bacterium LVI A0078]|nr:hypothetical protein RZE84_07120 [Mollicutes bacterium LVI A0075]WOO90494.1 hypothetical protein R2F61_07115 [Mollicutes bacterium LVI A0078]
MAAPKVNVMHQYTDKDVVTLKYGRQVSFSGKLAYDNDTIAQKKNALEVLSGLPTKAEAKLSGKLAYDNNTGITHKPEEEHSEYQEYLKLIKTPSGKRCNHDKYFTNWIDMNEFFTSEGILEFGSDETKTFLDKFDSANLLGSTVISFSEEMGEELKQKKLGEKEMFETLSPFIDNYFRQNNLVPSNMLYNFSFHSDQDNLHIHLDFVEKEEMSTDFHMDEKSFFDIKKNILFEYDTSTQEIHKEILKKVEEVRQDTRESVKNTHFDITDKQYKKAFSIIKDEDIPRYYGDIESVELKSVIGSIAKKHNEQFNTYKTALHVFENYQKGLYGNSKKAAYFENKMEEMDKFARNEIYRQLKTEYFEQFKLHFEPVKPKYEQIATKPKQLHIKATRHKTRREREFEKIEREIYEGLEYL